MVDIRIDTSSLTYKNFLILGQTATPVDGSIGTVLTLSPGTYTFQQPDIDADFLFEITSEGFVTYTPAHDSFLSGQGTSALFVRGLSITLDATLLSHNLLPTVGGANSLLRDRTHEMHLLPASRYGFYVERGILADFLFGVDANGQVIVDSRFAGFAQADGLTLKILGYRLTLDGRALSHDLKPIVIESFLPRDRTHELTLIPAFGYTFQPASGIVADFQFNLDVNGQVVVDPRYEGFATVNGRSLTISGYQITIDGQQLSHDLAVSIWAANQNILSRDRTHELTLIPAVGYSFVSAPGIAADFRFNVDVNGQIVIDPRYGGFATANGRTLTINGYQVTIDTSELSYDLLPLLLGWVHGNLSPGMHKLTAIPANDYTLQVQQGGLPNIRFSLNALGITTLTDAPDEMVIMSNQIRCAVPDRIVTPLQIQTYGSPGGRWSRGVLTVSINPTNANLPPNVVSIVISNAFNLWRQVNWFFTFSFVPNNGDIQVSFGGSELDRRFGSTSGVAGSAPYPEGGRVQFDSSENWTQQFLLTLALHEIGHALGLSHSNDPASIMFPIVPNLTTIDPESRDALRNLYGWRPPTPLTDRATSDRPAMAVSTSVNFTSSVATLHMVWKGSRDDQHFYESRLENNSWTPQRPIPGPISSHSPAIASLPLNDGTPSTGLIMAWKGGGDDQGLYFATNRGNDWTPQENIPNVGSSHRPALANFDIPYMAWKGVHDDQGIYWSRYTRDGWQQPQQRIRGVGTSSSPALVVFQSRLYLFWKGIEGDSQIWYSWLEATPNAIWQPQRVVAFADTETEGGIFVNIGSTHEPSATVRGDRILLAWKGIEGDRGIYFSLFDGNEFTGQIRVNGVGTTQGPGVCQLGGITHMAWKGVEGDNVIYWSTL